MNIKKSPRGRKPIHVQSYDNVPFTKMKVGETYPVSKNVSLKAAMSINASVLRITRNAYKRKQFEVDIAQNQIIVRRTK